MEILDEYKSVVIESLNDKRESLLNENCSRLDIDAIDKIKVVDHIIKSLGEITTDDDFECWKCGTSDIVETDRFCPHCLACNS